VLCGFAICGFVIGFHMGLSRDTGDGCRYRILTLTRDAYVRGMCCRLEDADMWEVDAD
jgi:hypothetical protein